MEDHMRTHTCVTPALTVLTALALLAAPARAQTLSGSALADALRRGGYVIVMRHAASPAQAPDKATANPDNVNLERQLDAAGRASATAMGKALRDLKIPIGEVASSPTYRALETVRLAQLPAARTYVEIGDGGQSMQASTDAQAAWLQRKVAEAGAPGSNILVVTHMPNIARAFPQLASGVADGEALVFHPDGKGGATLVARVKIEEWPKLG